MVTVVGKRLRARDAKNSAAGRKPSTGTAAHPVRSPSLRFTSARSGICFADSPTISAPSRKTELAVDSSCIIRFEYRISHTSWSSRVYSLQCCSNGVENDGFVPTSDWACIWCLRVGYGEKKAREKNSRADENRV